MPPFSSHDSNPDTESQPSSKSTTETPLRVVLQGCPPALQAPLAAALQALGFGVEATAEAAQIALLWTAPFADDVATQVMRLRAARADGPIAILAVGEATGAAAYQAAAQANCDGYTAASDPLLLAAQAQLLAYCARRFADVSPLTGLPGNNALQREIERRLPRRGRLAVLAFDLDSFKSYNDAYGYVQGDALLRFLHSVIVKALTEKAQPGWFAAHVGGDDFFALLLPEEAESVARRAIELFEAGSASYYAPQDRERGAVLTRARTGEVLAQPLVSLTVGAVTNEPADLLHAGQLAAVLAELKAHGKSLPGSNYVPDRRKIHDHEVAWLSRASRSIEPEQPLVGD